VNALEVETRERRGPAPTVRNVRCQAGFFRGQSKSGGHRPRPENGAQTDQQGSPPSDRARAPIPSRQIGAQVPPREGMQAGALRCRATERRKLAPHVVVRAPIWDPALAWRGGAHMAREGFGGEAGHAQAVGSCRVAPGQARGRQRAGCSLVRSWWLQLGGREGVAAGWCSGGAAGHGSTCAALCPAGPFSTVLAWPS